MMARGGNTQIEAQGEEGIKENKIVMTELMGQLLKQGKD
jgi:hypothetical protein